MASDSLARLEMQWVAAAGLAEAACRTATGQPAAPPASTADEPTREEPPSAGDGTATPAPELQDWRDPRLRQVDREKYLQTMQALSDSLLDHFSGS